MAATNLFRMALLSVLLVSAMNAAPTRLQATTEVEETTAATTELVTEAEQIGKTHPVLGDIHPALAKIDERIINRRRKYYIPHVTTNGLYRYQIYRCLIASRMVRSSRYCSFSSIQISHFKTVKNSKIMDSANQASMLFSRMIMVESL